MECDMVCDATDNFNTLECQQVSPCCAGVMWITVQGGLFCRGIAAVNWPCSLGLCSLCRRCCWWRDSVSSVFLFQDETNSQVSSPFQMVSFGSLPHSGRGADLHKTKHFQKKGSVIHLMVQKGKQSHVLPKSSVTDGSFLKEIKESAWWFGVVTYVQVTTVCFRVMLCCHLVFKFGSSAIKTKKGMGLEGDVNQDFYALLTRAFSSQPSLTRELKTLPQSCADQELSTRWAACAWCMSRLVNFLLFWFCGKWLVAVSDRRGQCRE